jgi:hypothetical protein
MRVRTGQAPTSVLVQSDKTLSEQFGIRDLASLHEVVSDRVGNER